MSRASSTGSAIVSDSPSDVMFPVTRTALPSSGHGGPVEDPPVACLLELRVVELVQLAEVALDLEPVLRGEPPSRR